MKTLIQLDYIITIIIYFRILLAGQQYYTHRSEFILLRGLLKTNFKKKYIYLYIWYFYFFFYI